MKDEKQQGQKKGSFLILQPCGYLLGLNVYINLLGSSASKYSISVNEEQDQYNDYEDRYNRDHPRVAPTSTLTVVGHDAAPSPINC